MAGDKEEEEKVQDKVSKTKEMKCREYTHKLIKEEEGVVQSVTKVNLFLFFPLEYHGSKLFYLNFNKLACLLKALCVFFDR